MNFQIGKIYRFNSITFTEWFFPCDESRRERRVAYNEIFFFANSTDPYIIDDYVVLTTDGEMGYNSLPS